MRGIFQTPSCTTYSYDFSDRIDSSVAMTLCRNTHPPSSAWLKQVPDRFSLLVVGWWHQDTSVYVCEPFYSGVSPTTDTGRAGWRPAGPTNYCNSGCCLLDRLLTKTNVILVSFVCFLFVCADVLALWWEVHPTTDQWSMGLKTQHINFWTFSYNCQLRTYMTVSSTLE